MSQESITIPSKGIDDPQSSIFSELWLQHGVSFFTPLCISNTAIPLVVCESRGLIFERTASSCTILEKFLHLLESTTPVLVWTNMAKCQMESTYPVAVMSQVAFYALYLMPWIPHSVVPVFVLNLKTPPVPSPTEPNYRTQGKSRNEREKELELAAMLEEEKVLDNQQKGSN